MEAPGDLRRVVIFKDGADKAKQVLPFGLYDSVTIKHRSSVGERFPGARTGRLLVTGHYSAIEASPFPGAAPRPNLCLLPPKMLFFVFVSQFTLLGQLEPPIRRKYQSSVTVGQKSALVHNCGYKKVLEMWQCEKAWE